MFLGFPKKCHHTKLVQALGISSVKHIVLKNSCNLLYRSFTANRMTYNVNQYIVNLLLNDGIVVKGSLVGKIFSNGLNPSTAAINNKYFNSVPTEENLSDGITDSIKFILNSCNEVKKHSNEYNLIFGLIRCF